MSKVLPAGGARISETDAQDLRSVEYPRQSHCGSRDETSLEPLRKRTRLRHRELHDILYRIETAESAVVVSEIFRELQGTWGISHIAYQWLDNADGLRICTTLPEEWVQRYLERDYYKVDPVVLGCLSGFSHVDWSALDWSSRPTMAYREDAIQHGVGTQGCSFPVRGPGGQFGVLSITATCELAEWQKFVAKVEHDLMLIAHSTTQRAIACNVERPIPLGMPLSPREVETLCLLAEGHSRARVAHMLQISEHTLRVYIEGARTKLQANNTTHAVAKAMSIGLISL